MRSAKETHVYRSLTALVIVFAVRKPRKDLCLQEAQQRNLAPFSTQNVHIATTVFRRHDVMITQPVSTNAVY